VNKRAEAYWRLREALDPSQDGGSRIAPPPDSALSADLAAPRWKLTPRGIPIESKEDIVRRIGRSPVKGDAVEMCRSEGERAARRKLRDGRALQTRANVAYADQKGVVLRQPVLRWQGHNVVEWESWGNQLEK
jgi:hypothetical protein